MRINIVGKCIRDMIKTALKKKGTRILYYTVQKGSEVNGLVEINELLMKIKGVSLNEESLTYKFPNGSSIVVDYYGKTENIRGKRFDMVILDEFA